MSRCILSPTATKDLDTISDYFCDRNVSAGEKLFEQFVSKCTNLINFPALGRSYEHIRPNMRGVPLDGYIIFYQVVADGIEILRVVNGRQDLEALFSID
jgi:toxin ParE1/3/4